MSDNPAGTEPAYLDALLTVLRKHGVLRYQDGDLAMELTLSDAPAPAMNYPKMAEFTRP